jgi:predicted MFS family arabinose efflux permease
MQSPLSPGREKALLFTLMAMQLTSILDFMIMMPLSAQLMAAFDIGTTGFGVLVSAYSLAAGVSAFLAAAVLDRFDRRQALLVVFAGLILATLACALAQNHLQMLGARVVAGLFGGVLGSIVMAIVGDLIAPNRRGKAMGIVMMAFSLASVAGVPLGLFIAGRWDWHAPFMLLVLLGVLIAPLAWALVPPMRGHLSARPEHFWQSLRALLSVPNHWWGFATAFLVMFAGFMVIPYIAPSLTHNAGLPLEALPYIYGVGGAATLLSRPWIGSLTDRYPQARVLAGVTLASCVPVLLVTQSFTGGLAYQLCVAALFFVLVSGRFIPCSALVTGSCTTEFRGRVMAFSSALQNLGAGLAALLSGAIMSQNADGSLVHYSWVGYLSCLVALAAIATAWRVKAVS